MPDGIVKVIDENDKEVIADETHEKLGKYFTHFNIYERTGISFEKFVPLVKNGLWSSCILD